MREDSHKRPCDVSSEGSHTSSDCSFSDEERDAIVLQMFSGIAGSSSVAPDTIEEMELKEYLHE